MLHFDTTSNFISNRSTTSAPTAGDIVKTYGYSSVGGLGGSRWKATGNVIAVSQDPLTLNDIKLSDASGNEYELVVEESGIIDLNVLGGTSAAYENIATTAGLTFSQGLTSDISNDIVNVDTAANLIARNGVSVGEAFSVEDRASGIFDAKTGLTANGFNILQSSTDGSIQYDLRVDPRDIDMIHWGLTLDEVTDNTSTVQIACDLIGAEGGVIKIPFGAVFSLFALNLTNRTTLQYREDDNSDKVDILPGSNELVKFLNNGNPNGAVNEDKLASGFHPAHILNAIPSQDPTNLGPGQDLGNPRSSYLHQVDGRDYIQHGINENGDWVLNKFETQSTLSGVRGDLFSPSALTAGDVVTGDTSGAVGIFLSSGPTDMTVSLRTGNFVNGENLTSGANTSDTSINADPSNAIISRVFAMIMRNYEQGAGFNVQPEDIVSNHTVGGTVTIGQQTAGGANEIGSLKIQDLLTSPTNGIEFRPKAGSTTEIEIYNQAGTLQAVYDFLSQARFLIDIVRTNSTAAESFTFAGASYDPLTDTPPITSSNPFMTSGTGTPEGVVSAPVGSIFTRTDGGASTTLYVKESGAGNTGWIAK